MLGAKRNFSNLTGSAGPHLENENFAPKHASTKAEEPQEPVLIAVNPFGQNMVVEESFVLVNVFIKAPIIIWVASCGRHQEFAHNATKSFSLN